MKEEREIEIKFWLFIENYISERTLPADLVQLAEALSILTKHPVVYINRLIQDILNASMRLKPSQLELIQVYSESGHTAKETYTMLNLSASNYYKKLRDNKVYWVPRYNELQRQVMKDVLDVIALLDRSVIK